MDNLMVLENGFDIDLGLNTTFKAFRESFEFRSIADIQLIKKIRDNQWNSCRCLQLYMGVILRIK